VLSLINCYISLKQDGNSRKIRISSRVQALKSDGGKWKKTSSDSDDDDDDDDDENDAPTGSAKNDPYLMSLEERLEWRRAIRQVLDKEPNVEEELEPEEKKKKLQKLMDDYSLVVDEDDPNWPEDADGWGFSLGQFFDKITIKNQKKDDDNDDNDDDVDRPEIVWQDDNYIRPIKDIKTAEWEETVFKDISPLIVLVHNRYRRLTSVCCLFCTFCNQIKVKVLNFIFRPKENEKIRDELEKAVHIIWNCRLPSPRVSTLCKILLPLVSATLA